MWLRITRADSSVVKREAAWGKDGQPGKVCVFPHACMCICVCVCLCLCMSVCVCLCVCLCECVLDTNQVGSWSIKPNCIQSPNKKASHWVTRYNATPAHPPQLLPFPKTQNCSQTLTQSSCQGPCLPYNPPGTLFCVCQMADFEL